MEIVIILLKQIILYHNITIEVKPVKLSVKRLTQCHTVTMLVSCVWCMVVVVTFF